MKRVEELDMLFQSVINRFFMIRTKQPAHGAVTFAQMRVLWALEMVERPSQGGVARMLGITNSTATELVDRLVRGGYVKRDHPPEDRRRCVLSLLSRGRSMLADFARRRRERFRRLLKVVRPSDVDDMARALRTMNRVLSQWHENGAARAKG